jgi:CubicO group peptidase (beta-lactamase class C family)
LQLIEKELLSLDDPLSKFIPEYKDPVVLIESFADSSFSSRPATQEITIRHLLTHNSGIGYGFQSDMYNALVIKNGVTEGFEERPIETQENIKRIANLPLLHDPGEKWTYSLSFDVLGAVIEIVSGKSLDIYFKEHIFLPLGMNDTYFYLPEEKSNRLVSVYEHAVDKKGFIPATYPFCQYPVQGAKTYMSGGADLSSTIEDIGTFALMLANGGRYNGSKILDRKYVDMMTSKQSDHGWWDSDIGFGVLITTKAGAVTKPQSEGMFEFGGFFDTFCWVDPKKELVAVLFLQMYPNNEFDIHYKFRTLTYECIENIK